MRFLLLALLATLCSVGFAGEFADISHDELVKAIEAKQVVLLDANGSESYAKGHIPGALDFQAVKADLAAKLPADKGALVVAYCGNPACKAYQAAAKAAQELGYTNVKHYSAGIAGWKASGAKVETADAGKAVDAKPVEKKS